MKNKFSIVLICILVAMGICLFYLYQKNYNNNLSVSSNGNSGVIVGGDRDIHGCIGSAGYSWCQAKNKCLRVWEEKCDSIIVSPATTTTNIESLCKQKNGVYYSTEKLCEVNQLSKTQCLAQNGQFNECASACRHDPKAQVCNMMCVLTCTFK